MPPRKRQRSPVTVLVVSLGTSFAVHNGLRGPSPLPERADRLPQFVGYFVAGYASPAPEGRGNPHGCCRCEQSSQRTTRPPRAAVRQFLIAPITFMWPRLTWPALARRQVGPCPEGYPQRPERDAP